MEAEACLGKILQPAHVLADGDAIAEQDRMCGPCAICCVVDVVGINPDERRACIDQELRRFSGEKGVPLEILIGAPVTRPSGMDQDRLAG